MIVKGDTAAAVNRAADTESIPSNPPPYSARNDASGSSGVPNPIPSGPVGSPPTATRCNFLTIRLGNSPIKGAFIIDPNLQVPNELLAPLEDGESEKDRPNLKLKCQNASITADVWVDNSGYGEVDAPANSGDTKKKVIIDVYSHNGSATVKLNADLLNQPVKVKVKSHNGSASLLLPSTFTGPLTIGSKNGGVTISDMIQARSTMVSDSYVKVLRSYFVGEFGQAAGLRTGEWPGSSVHVESHNGRVRVAFTEEDIECGCKRESSGFFSRWFGGA